MNDRKTNAILQFHSTYLGRAVRPVANVFLKKWAKPGLFLVYFRSFSQHKDKYSTNFTINYKSIDGVLGSRTRGDMMEGADKSTELWRHPNQWPMI